MVWSRSDSLLWLQLQLSLSGLSGRLTARRPRCCPPAHGWLWFLLNLGLTKKKVASSLLDTILHWSFFHFTVKVGGEQIWAEWWLLTAGSRTVRREVLLSGRRVEGFTLKCRSSAVETSGGLPLHQRHSLFSFIWKQNIELCVQGIATLFPFAIIMPAFAISLHCDCPNSHLSSHCRQVWSL